MTMKGGTHGTAKDFFFTNGIFYWEDIRKYDMSI